MTQSEGRKATDYSFTDDDVVWLAGIVQWPAEMRRETLGKIAEKRGVDSLVEMFAQFIGMANSVVENMRDSLETFGIIYGDISPYQAEKINLPTILGALMGVRLAKFGCDNVCHGCAFRLGSLANQSPSTTEDADWCGHEGERPFMCHEDLRDGEPTKVCQGWVRLRQSRKTHTNPTGRI